MPANQYSDSLLMDALRGSLSNLESLGRGAAVAPIGLLGDINALAREYVTPRLPQSVQGLLQAAPAAPTTEQILANIPRVSQPRMETSGMEQLGAAMNPRGPVDLARGAGRLAGSAVNEAMVYGRGPLAAITPQPMRMDVWHGSPYGPIKKFDSSKIGTGEGNQAYGHGLYFGEARGTGEGYREALSGSGKKLVTATFNDDPELWVAGQLYSNVDPKDIKEGLNILNYQGNADDLIKSAKTRLNQEKSAGYLYKVDLPDEAIAKMLDWDKPLSQQPDSVQSWLKDSFNPYRKELTAKDVGGNEPTGSLIYNRLQELMSEGKKSDAFSNQANYGAANASREMMEAGITGVRYLDEGSRDAGKGTSNFVVFPQNESLLTIKEINDQPVSGLLAP